MEFQTKFSELQRKMDSITHRLEDELKNHLQSYARDILALGLGHKKVN